MEEAVLTLLGYVIIGVCTSLVAYDTYCLYLSRWYWKALKPPPQPPLKKEDSDV